MNFFDILFSRFRMDSPEITERMRSNFFTVRDETDLSHRQRCRLYTMVQSGKRPKDSMLRDVSDLMSRAQEETLSHLLYELSQNPTPLELPLEVTMMLQKDAGIKMFADDSVIGTDGTD